MSVGSPKYTNGFADIFGGRQFNTIDYTGPTSYNNTGTPATSGDTLSHRMFSFENTIECIIDASIDQTGTYQAVDQPVNSGVTAWRLRWFNVSTGVEAPNGTNLSAYTVRISAIGF